MTTDATLTSKGQTTILKEIRDRLGMKPGDRMTFTLMPDATVVMRVKSKRVTETLHAFMRLREAGKIRHYGVSNLDLADMQELWRAPGGEAVQTNQLLYNLTRRGIEWDLLPRLRERCLPVMAYSPIEQGRLIGNRKLGAFAARHGMTPAQAALAWLLEKDDVIAIPKTGRRERLKENLAALEHRLAPEQLAEIDQLFAPPKSASSLQML